MKKSLVFASTLGLGCAMLSVAASSLSAAPAAKPLRVHQEPRGVGHLLAPGDRPEIVYTVDTRGITSPTGSLYVRDDRTPRFERLSLKLKRGPGSPTLQTRVPGRLLRGHKLIYYAVVTDRRSHRSATIPARGAAAPQAAWVIGKSITVKLGTHRFDELRAPDAVVARARADEVGFEVPPPDCGCGPGFGPQTFLVGRDQSIWLHDGLNKRLLAWAAGRPDVIQRTVPLPFFAGQNDIALGPAHTMYVTRVVGIGLGSHLVLYRLSDTGQVLWESRLAGSFFGSTSFMLGATSALRVGPDGTLYCLVGMFGLVGGEWGWMPVATPAGRPLRVGAQRRRTDWPFQPVAGGLRLVSETYTPPNAETAPHEVRVALIDRRNRAIRAWRVLSRTDINLGNGTNSELVGGDPVVVLDVTAQIAGNQKWERVVLRLGSSGTRARFSLPRAVWGANLLADIRIGADGNLYQLATSPTTGIVISRYAPLGSGRRS